MVLFLTLFGIAYTSFSKRPFILYWEFLALVVGVVCVWTGWRRASDRDARAPLIWTQALHWLAFLAAMNLLLLSTVQSMLNADATGLAILMLLALGTFIAGVHMLAWEICVLGVVMAFFVPAMRIDLVRTRAGVTGVQPWASAAALSISNRELVITWLLAQAAGEKHARGAALLMRPPRTPQMQAAKTAHESKPRA